MLYFINSILTGMACIYIILILCKLYKEVFVFSSYLQDMCSYIMGGMFVTLLLSLKTNSVWTRGSLRSFRYNIMLILRKTHQNWISELFSRMYRARSQSLVALMTWIVIEEPRPDLQYTTMSMVCTNYRSKIELYILLGFSE